MPDNKTKIADDDPVLIDIVVFSNREIAKREGDKGNSRLSRKKVVENIVEHIQQVVDNNYSEENW